VTQPVVLTMARTTIERLIINSPSVTGATTGSHALSNRSNAAGIAAGEAYRGTVSLPFEPGESRRIAVKIVDDRGIESLKLMALDTI